jgi:outer membrane receptor protein involved in Fe transport
VAAGASYRRDWFNQNVTPTELQAGTNMPAVGENIGYRGLPQAYRGIDNIFERGPSTSPSGGYYVWEVFGEALVPLAVDRKFARTLDLNTAVRYANYQGSGGIMAWKLGLDWAPLNDVRFRATASRDVRAGTLSERFDTTRGPGTVTDPFSGTNVPQVFSQIAGGNPGVKPEKADTLTFGAVYQPSWLTGFGISADVYDIDIKDAIGQLTVQNIVDQCFAGVQSLCALISRDSDGAINEIRNVFINIAQAKTRGIDIETFYNRPITLFGGNETLRVRAFATYVAENSTIAQAGAPKIDRAGQTGPAGAGGGNNGAPDWQANVSLGYSNGGFSASIQERYISSGMYNSTYTAADINDNTVDAAYYTNLRLGFESELNNGTGYEIYANVTNLFDADPPLAPGFIFTGTSHTNTTLFDTIGRRYNLGVTVKF